MKWQSKLFSSQKNKLAIQISLILFLIGLTAVNTLASVVQGRQYLFNDGNPTYSGIILANERFKAAIMANPADQQANVFYSVTCILADALNQNNTPNFETIEAMGDLLGAFGLFRNNNNSVNTGSPFSDLPEINGQYNPPLTVPDGQKIRLFLAGPFISLLDTAIDSLDKIDNTLHITLLPEEIGDSAVEIDYGDVLLYRSSLHFMKSYVHIVTAYNLDIDIRELVAKINSKNVLFQQDILDKYPALLTLIDSEGIRSLTNAKESLFRGINDFQGALAFIKAESDFQGNDLFSFGGQEDLDDAQDFLTALLEVQTSLDENRSADIGEPIDFNSVFGTNDAPPLDIRKVLPEFTVYNEILAGSLPENPVLNGIFLDLENEEEVINKWDLPYWVVSNNLPSKVTLRFPSNLIENTLPALSWDEDLNATWYKILIWDSSDERVHTQWYDESDICSEGNCSVSLESELLVGEYEWWVKSWNDHGSIWSAGMSFTIQGNNALPSKVTHTSPSGQLAASTSTFTWKKDPVSTWYKLWIGHKNGNRIFAQWYDAANICSGGTCSVTTGTELDVGNYEWYIKSWNDYGKIWSDGMFFSLGE